MTGRDFRVILPHFQKLFARGADGGASDGVLLHRYCSADDATAFESLLARHGGMVWSVCRGILRDEPTAEDAFQAVFLILVRKAGAIRCNDSIGGWLYTVAVRTARRARADLANRRLREGAPLAIDPPDTSDAALDPRLVEIHEEIARLSARERQAIVLCRLEGKTQTEAAREIGCGEATLRRRLAAGLERLKSRLNRKGLELEAAFPATLPTLAPRLVREALRAVREPISKLAAAVLLDQARIHGLTFAAGLASLILSGSGVALGLIAQKQRDPGAATARANGESQRAEAKATPKVPALDPDDPFGLGEVEIPGRVIDPTGKPIAGATVFLRKYGVHAPERKASTDASGRFVFRTKRVLGPRIIPKPDNAAAKPSGAAPEGKAPENQTTEYVAAPYPDSEEIASIKPMIVATATGYGFGTLAAGDGVTIQLAPDEPVIGRVRDLDGRPIPGARVRVRDAHWPRVAKQALRARVAPPDASSPPSAPADPGLDPWLDRVRRAADMSEFMRAWELLGGLLEGGFLGDKPVLYEPMIKPAVTDAEGRFTLRGIGKERVVELYIDGVADHASSLVLVATRSIGKTIHVPYATPSVRRMIGGAPADTAIYGARFETILEPGRAIEGVVSDRDGARLSGVRVIGPVTTPLEYPGFDRYFATTDAQGGFRIEGFPVRTGAEFKVDPPENAPYFGRKVELTIARGAGPVPMNVSLRRGVWITGKVIDDSTGKGLPHQTIEYHVFTSNKFLYKDVDEDYSPEFDDNLRTDDEGRFRIRGYPGRGIVTAGGGRDYLQGVGADAIKSSGPGDPESSLYDPRGFSPYLRNTTVVVEIPRGTESFDCTLRLKKGKSRQVRVVGPDGKPRTNLEASGLANQIENPITKLEGSFFQVTNLKPGERRATVARCVDERLIGMAEVSEADEGPVTLTLSPWARLKGRLVDDDGAPRSRGLSIVLEDGNLPIHTMNGRNYDKQEFLIEPDGRFRIEALVPNAKYRLRLLEGDVLFLGDVTGDFQLSPGENRDLGDVRIKK